jgi:MYXO-CTERM domain-containing protein
MNMKIRSFGMAGIAALLASAGVASANPVYTFQNITNNNAADAATGEAQLRMEVMNLSSTQVGFKFTNIGPGVSAITDIYFDDRAPGALTTLAGIENSTLAGAQVDFKQFASPTNLPGGGSLSPAFVTNLGFSAESKSPAFHNGVGNHASEYVTIIFDFASSGYSAVIQALLTGSLRVGLHVQGFDGGGSESFINGRGEGPLAGDPPTPVIPLPTTAGLGLFGLLAVGGHRRRAR